MGSVPASPAVPCLFPAPVPCTLIRVRVYHCDVHAIDLLTDIGSLQVSISLVLTLCIPIKLVTLRPLGGGYSFHLELAAAGHAQVFRSALKLFPCMWSARADVSSILPLE